MSQTFASVENRVVEALRAQGRRSVAYRSNGAPAHLPNAR